MTLCASNRNKFCFVACKEGQYCECEGRWKLDYDFLSNTYFMQDLSYDQLIEEKINYDKIIFDKFNHLGSSTIFIEALETKQYVESIKEFKEDIYFAGIYHSTNNMNMHICYGHGKTEFDALLMAISYFKFCLI